MAALIVVLLTSLASPANAEYADRFAETILDTFFEMSASAHRAYFPASLKSPVLLMSGDRHGKFSLGEMSCNAGECHLGSPHPVSAQIGDETVVYPETFEPVDIEYPLTARGIQEFFVLKQRPRAPAGHLTEPTLDFALTIGASVAEAAADGSSGDGASCFIATVATTEAALVVTDWSVGSIFGLLAFIGLLWLGKRRKG